jgi:hypothetical protein
MRANTVGSVIRHVCVPLSLPQRQHAIYSYSGTFLFNNEFERAHYELAAKTTSLWSFVNLPHESRPYVNPLFEAYEKPLLISAHPAHLQPWTAQFSRWYTDTSVEDEVQDILLFYNDRVAAVSRESNELKARLRAVEKQIQNERDKLVHVLREYIATGKADAPVSDEALSVSDFDPLSKPTHRNHSMSEMLDVVTEELDKLNHLPTSSDVIQQQDEIAPGVASTALAERMNSFDIPVDFDPSPATAAAVSEPIVEEDDLFDFGDDATPSTQTPPATTTSDPSAPSQAYQDLISLEALLADDD